MFHHLLFYPLALILLRCFAGTASGANAQYIFHGTSIVIYPNATSEWPSDSKFVAANFYCYFTPLGYLSFGWYVVVPFVSGLFRA